MHDLQRGAAGAVLTVRTHAATSPPHDPELVRKFTLCMRLARLQADQIAVAADSHAAAAASPMLACAAVAPSCLSQIRVTLYPAHDVAPRCPLIPITYGAGAGNSARPTSRQNG